MQKISGLDRSRLPKHIAIIMDGNGRWARARRRPRLEGHRQGLESAKSIIRFCHELGGIECVTLYAFSTENWRRPALEIKGLFQLLKFFLRRETEELMAKGIKFRTIGRLTDFPDFVQEELARTMEATAGGGSLTLNIALNYGARQEIIDAALKLHEQLQSGAIAPDQVDEEIFSGLLNTHGLPDPDLMIRTSGEMRISNFLLWQLAYAELYVTPVCWPDFGPSQLLDAIIDYQGRDRRYGGIGREDAAPDLIPLPEQSG